MAKYTYQCYFNDGSAPTVDGALIIECGSETMLDERTLKKAASTSGWMIGLDTPPPMEKIKVVGLSKVEAFNNESQKTSGNVRTKSGDFESRAVWKSKLLVYNTKHFQDIPNDNTKVKEK